MAQFMARDAMLDLLAWKDDPARKPLLLTGARQVGKTELAQEFGRTHFENVAYLELDNTETFSNIFSDFNIDRMLMLLGVATGQEINPGRTLLILDEIQEQPKAITALKYFCEQRRDLHIIASGSYLGLTIHEGTGFPVGKVDQLTLRPLSFSEFLAGVGQEGLRTAIQSGDPAIWEALSEQLDQWLRLYFIVGGMPEMVARYRDSHSTARVRRAQETLLGQFGMSISKHLPESEVPRARLVWDAVPGQLAKENRRLIFSQISASARGRDYLESVQALADAGLVTLVRAVSAVQLPLASFQEPNAFKAFFLDIGLLGAALGLAPESLLDPDEFYAQHSGVMAEQFVIQSLLVLTGRTPFYYSSSKPAMELDAIFAQRGKVCIAEVKAGQHVRSASLRLAHERYGDVARYVRFSRLPYARQDWLTNIPLFAIEATERWLEQ